MLAFFFKKKKLNSVCMHPNMGFTTSTETEEGIAQAIIRGKVDLERDPWPKVSEEAKDLVKSMLDPNPYSRMTVQEVLGMYPFTCT
jgi:hypothetical protein